MAHRIALTLMATALFSTAGLAAGDVDARQKALDAPLAGDRRAPLKRTAEAERLTAAARDLRMPGAAIDNPCIRYVGADCVKTALEPFFASLDLARDGKGQARTVVLGNSLIASDHITDVVRARFVEAVGDAGPGFLLADRMAPYGRRDRTGYKSQGFGTYNISMGEFGPYPHGLSGVLHVSTSAARTTWKTDGGTRGRIFWLDDAGAQPFSVKAGGKTILEVKPGAGGGSRVSEFKVPAKTKEVELVVDGPGTVIYGATFEKEGAGFTLDTMGVVSVDASIFMKEDERVFTQQLQALSPSMVTLFLGGNEIKRVKWGRRGLADVRKDLDALFARVHTAAPEAACLVIGPLENVYGSDKKEPFKTRPETQLVNETLHKMAVENGCAFFDLFAAMGGEGALERLNARGFLHDDLVHPKSQGLDVSGQLIADAIFDAYGVSTRAPDVSVARARWKAIAEGAVVAARGRRDDPGRLGELGRRLLDVSARRASRASFSFALPEGEEGRVLADEVSLLMKRRFGDRGRGLVPAGDDDVPSTLAAGASWQAPYEVGASFIDVYWMAEGSSLSFSRAWSSKRKAQVDEKTLAGGVKRSRVRLPPRDRIMVKADKDARLLGVAVEPDDWRGVVIDRVRGAGERAPMIEARPVDAILALAGRDETPDALGKRLELFLGASKDAPCVVILPPNAKTSASQIPGIAAERCGVVDAAALLPPDAWKKRGHLDGGGGLTDDGQRVLATVVGGALLRWVDERQQLAVKAP